MFDHFAIGANKTHYGHKFGDEADWMMEWGHAGTTVTMELSNHTARRSEKIFDPFASAEGDYGFNKTVVPVKLTQYGNDKLISRSQANRVVARLELFKTVLFDFAGVPTIGQAFADEIFRVFSNEHPNTSIPPTNANSEVRRMIRRVTQGGASVGAAVSPTASEEESS
jgi:hypothetical protein